MADGVVDSNEAAATAGDDAVPTATKPKRALTPAQKRKRRREQEAARRKGKHEREAAERAAALPPAELVAEEEQGREVATATGAAKTILNAALYRKVFRMWTQGWAIADLADEHGLSERRVGQIVDDLRGSALTRLGVGDTLFSVKFAQRLVLQRSAAVAQYARMAEKLGDDLNVAHIKLGYLKQRDEALSKFTELVQELGWLPKHLGTINTQMDALQMAEVLLEVMDQQGISIEVQQIVVESIELRVVRRGPGLALAGVGPDLEGFAADMTTDEVHDGMGPGDSGDGEAGGGGDQGEEQAHEPAAA